MKENKSREEMVRTGVQAAIVGVGHTYLGRTRACSCGGEAPEASGQQEWARATVYLTLTVQSKADLVGLG